jgi:Cyclin
LVSLVRIFGSRIHRYASCSNECFILALIYIDRLIQKSNFLLTELNIHRVCVTAVLLAAKFFDDAYYNNAYFAKVGGVMISEMNSLEVDFLFRINFSLHVTPDVFDKYRSELLAQSMENPLMVALSQPPSIPLSGQDRSPRSMSEEAALAAVAAYNATMVVAAAAASSSNSPTPLFDQYQHGGAMSSDHGYANLCSGGPVSMTADDAIRAAHLDALRMTAQITPSPPHYSAAQILDLALFERQQQEQQNAAALEAMVAYMASDHQQPLHHQNDVFVNTISAAQQQRGLMALNQCGLSQMGGLALIGSDDCTNVAVGGGLVTGPLHTQPSVSCYDYAGPGIVIDPARPTMSSASLEMDAYTSFAPSQDSRLMAYATACQHQQELQSLYHSQAVQQDSFLQQTAPSTYHHLSHTVNSTATPMMTLPSIPAYRPHQLHHVSPHSPRDLLSQGAM